MYDNAVSHSAHGDVFEATVIIALAGALAVSRGRDAPRRVHARSEIAL